MRPVVTPAQMRALEKTEIETLGIPSAVLMDRAARACAQAVMARMQPGGCAAVLCGPGNNGGDGYWAALWILRMGGRVRVTAFAPSTGDAQTGRMALARLGVPIEQQFSGLDGCDVVLDALFGTGFHGALAGAYLEAVQAVARSGLPVVAVDIPSGVDGATGQAAGAAICAQETVTFACAKTGHLIFPGRAHTGRLTVADIGLDAPENCAQQIEPADLELRWLPKRPQDAHKGTFGHAALVVGAKGMAGAAVLAALGALRGGAGLVSVGCGEKSVLPVVQQAAFEAMAWPFAEDETGHLRGDDDFSAFLAGKSALGLGCGLGRGDGIASVVRRLAQADLPMVMDADALWVCGGVFGKQCVITPHPGEMARLTGLPAAQILKDPIGVAARFAKENDVTVLLKGATTVIAAPDGRIRLNTVGSPAMSTGGSGDVLTGVITALLAQGLTCFDAASAGACLHGMAGRWAGQTYGESAVTARDIAMGLMQLRG